VKAQTPVVAQTEKKKKPTGRCKKRALYKKRFCQNTAEQPRGRKVGPNSNYKGPMRGII